MENSAVCLSCGVKAGYGHRFCPSCGWEHDPNAVVCVKCGTSLANSNFANSTGGTNTFVNAIKTCLNKFATFEGRANRAEFWFWYLFLVLVSCVPIVGYIAGFVLLVPTLAASVRRLHDIGKDWKWILVSLIPIGGIIWLVVLLCQPSDEGDNLFGPNPNS